MNAKKKILVVEDEQDVSTYLTTLLQDSGYDTVLAEDGIQGLDMARSEKPDLITLDLAMPDKSGVRTFRQYREDEDLKKIPVIIITAVGDDMRNYFKKVPGFPEPEGFMSKPIDEDKLVKMVSDLLSK